MRDLKLLLECPASVLGRYKLRVHTYGLPSGVALGIESRCPTPDGIGPMIRCFRTLAVCKAEGGWCIEDGHISEVRRTLNTIHDIEVWLSDCREDQATERMLRRLGDI